MQTDVLRYRRPDNMGVHPNPTTVDLTLPKRKFLFDYRDDLFTSLSTSAGIVLS